jgi:dolichyl-phosphate-mannose--protein O-mannosyl transferase
MDETYYVPSAQGILLGHQCSPGADDCNLEHPFLSKAFIAAGMEVFGLYNDFGWRIFNAILGTACIPLLFVVVGLLSPNRKLAYFSCLLLSFDTMFFVHSSAAVIDIPAVFFTLLAFIFYLWKRSLWRIDTWMVSGIFLGLALLSKETAAFMVFALLSFHLYSTKSNLRQTASGALKLLIPAALVFILGLQIYASIYTSTSEPFFYQEIEYILKYGGGLTGPGWTDTVLGTYITPLNWLTYYTPIGYLVTRVTTTVTSASGTSTSQYVAVGYYGVTNPVVTWLVFAWVPIVAVAALRRGKKSDVDVSHGIAITESQPDPDLRAGIFALIWFGWGYLPYIPLWLYGRVTYPFYIVPAIPALAIGAAYFVTREWFPTKVAIIYLIAAFGWFFLYFPLKEFLPVWIRVLLGR